MVVSNHIISGKTKFIAHIGFPTHSFTAPKILNPCFKLLNKDLIVVPMGCKKKDLKYLIKGLKKLDNFFGALITMPHKEEIVSYLQKKKKCEYLLKNGVKRLWRFDYHSNLQKYVKLMN